MSISSEEGERLRSLIEEQRNAAAEHTVAARVAGSLIASARLQERLKLLSDFEIADVVFDFVFGGMDMLSPEAVIISEVMFRLAGNDREHLHNRQEGGERVDGINKIPTEPKTSEHP